MSNNVRSIRRGARDKSPKPPTVIALPVAIARQISQTDQQLLRLQEEMQTGQLVRENLILKAALELGLNQAKLATLEIAREADGRLVFRTPDKAEQPKQPEQKP